jgi:hypothetical protein
MIKPRRAIGIALLLPLTVYAQTDGQVAGYGRGTKDCGEYLEHRRVPNKMMDTIVAEWAYGFISGYNYFDGKPQLRGTHPPATVLAFLDKYCRDNPLAPAVNGIAEYIRVRVGR